MPANIEFEIDHQTNCCSVDDRLSPSTSPIKLLSSSENSSAHTSEDDEDQYKKDTNSVNSSKLSLINGNLSDNKENLISKNMNSSENVDEKTIPRFTSLPIRSVHEKFLRNCIEEILNAAVFNATDRKNKVLEWQSPENLSNIIDFKLKSNSDSDDKLFELIQNIIKYSVKTGHPYFVNQLFSGIDPYALIGQWLTDALNPSIYTYEVAPVFILMEEVVLQEMRCIVGFPNNGDGDGIFCPGGSIANGFGISCARFKQIPDIKKKGLFSLPRLVIFTSEDAHYSIEKLASFMGMGSENVYKIQTDSRGKMNVKNLEEEILRAKSEGAIPLMVSATSGTTVLGAFDPLEDIYEICKKYNLWMHVDAAWGGGALMSKKYRQLLKGIERADSVTWNPHKLLAAPQQCSTFLTKHKGILSEVHSTYASYLFQKDKFYDTKYDTGDKHIQCGRRVDVLKFWLMWRAKGSNGLEAHVNRIFENAEYFTEKIKQNSNFKMVLENPECTNICFWYIPPSLINDSVSPLDDDEYKQKLHKVAPKIKERMMKNGSMMITYQPLRKNPNFFRLVLQNSGLNSNDMDHIIDEIERLGGDL